MGIAGLAISVLLFVLLPTPKPTPAEQREDWMKQRRQRARPCSGIRNRSCAG